MSKLDVEVASDSFKKRYREESGKKKIENASLPAGSPMYFYCHGCTCLVDTLPENYWAGSPRKYCDPCRVLVDHGLLEGLLKEVKQQ